MTIYKLKDLLDSQYNRKDALRCIEKKCRARLSIEHDIPTEPFGSSKGRVIASSVLKEDLLNMENYQTINGSQY